MLPRMNILFVRLLSVLLLFILIAENIRGNHIRHKKPKKTNNDPTETKEWKEIVVWIGKMGKESMKRRISSFIIQNVTDKQLQLAEKLLHNVEVKHIAAVSAGASIFYRWSVGVMLWLIEEKNKGEDAIMRRATKAVLQVEHDMEHEHDGNGRDAEHVYDYSGHHDGWNEDGGQMRRM